MSKAKQTKANCPANPVVPRLDAENTPARHVPRLDDHASWLLGMSERYRQAAYETKSKQERRRYLRLVQAYRLTAFELQREALDASLQPPA